MAEDDFRRGLFCFAAAVSLSFGQPHGRGLTKKNQTRAFSRGLMSAPHSLVHFRTKRHRIWPCAGGDDFLRGTFVVIGGRHSPIKYYWPCASTSALNFCGI